MVSFNSVGSWTEWKDKGELHISVHFLTTPHLDHSCHHASPAMMDCILGQGAKVRPSFLKLLLPDILSQQQEK